MKGTFTPSVRVKVPLMRLGMGQAVPSHRRIDAGGRCGRRGRAARIGARVKVAGGLAVNGRGTGARSGLGGTPAHGLGQRSPSITTSTSSSSPSGGFDSDATTT